MPSEEIKKFAKKYYKGLKNFIDKWSNFKFTKEEEEINPKGVERIYKMFKLHPLDNIIQEEVSKHGLYGLIYSYDTRTGYPSIMEEYLGIWEENNESLWGPINVDENYNFVYGEKFSTYELTVKQFISEADKYMYEMRNELKRKYTNSGHSSDPVTVAYTSSLMLNLLEKIIEE